MSYIGNKLSRKLIGIFLLVIAYCYALLCYMHIVLSFVSKLDTSINNFLNIQNYMLMYFIEINTLNLSYKEINNFRNFIFLFYCKLKCNSQFIHRLILKEMCTKNIYNLVNNFIIVYIYNNPSLNIH